MFELPPPTIVDKAIPKNAFDKYVTPKQKKLLTSLVSRIRWMNKISWQTVNLQGKEVDEIQVFELELKHKDGALDDLLSMIDRVIPYHILFILHFNGEIKYSISQKHSNPTNDNQAVVDWRFSTEWVYESDDMFYFELFGTLDQVLENICFAVSGKKSDDDNNLENLILREERLAYLNHSISKLESAINKTKQFNKKVELNQLLQELKKTRGSL